MTKGMFWAGMATVMALGTGCSTTRSVSDVAAEVAKADKVREAADQARLERKQEVLEAKIKATPKWAVQAMKGDGAGVYAVGFGESDKIQVALKKAMLEAEFGLAKQFRQELSGSERIGVNDKGERAVSESYTQLIDKLVANVPLSGYEVIEQEIKPLQGQFSAWVLMRMTHDQMAKMASKESGAATDARMSAAFGELGRRVRERQEEQLRVEERRQEMRLKEMRVGA